MQHIIIRLKCPVLQIPAVGFMYLDMSLDLPPLLYRQVASHIVACWSSPLAGL